MKLSISLPEEDVALLDEVARRDDLPSRSAAVRRALDVLRGAELAYEYEDAWRDWTASGEAQAWEVTTPDGLQE